MFFSRLPAALSAVFQEDDLAECREQIEAQTSQLVPCKRARVILASGGRGEPRRKSGVARLSVPLFAHGRVLGTLALDRRERWSSPRERELVRSFAELASQALYALTVRCELFDLARTDPLTGVGNRRRLIEDLVRLTETGTPFRMLFVDVDGLKAVNDSEGHLAGDALLRLIGDTIRANVRSYDVIVRYGGDELVCAMPDVGAPEARARCDRIAAAVGEANASYSVTFGLAEAEPEDGLQELIARANADFIEARRSRTPGD